LLLVALAASFSKTFATREALDLAERVQRGSSIAEVRRLFGRSPEVDLYRDGQADWPKSDDGFIERRCILPRTCKGTSGHEETRRYGYLDPRYPFCGSSIDVKVYFERDADPKLAPYPGAPNVAVGWVVSDNRTCL